MPTLRRRKRHPCTTFLSSRACTALFLRRMNMKRRPEQRGPRTNQQIRAHEVRLINEQGANVGVVTLQHALSAAEAAGLDLVEVAAEATPPVCRIVDAGKLRYEESLKAKAARRTAQQAQHSTKDVKIRPSIAEHDLEVKLGHARKFLAGGHRVRITVMLRGREIGRPAVAVALLEKVISQLGPGVKVLSAPSVEGRDARAVLEASRS